jgi:hypothetical protein
MNVASLSLVGRDRRARRLVAWLRAARRSAPTTGLMLALLVTGCERAPKSCQVCQRDECKGLAFRVTLTTGKTVETCCPRCGLHYLESTKQQARALQATDYAGGQWIDATKAMYVSGSDVSACAGMETKRNAHGCCAFKDYDRCLPSLIAFEDEQRAVEFQKQHGGEIVTLDKLASH